jgi:hypothetical protein
LIQNGIELNAIFRTIDDYRLRWDSKDGPKLNFHDYYLFECAAYRLDRLLGLNHVPVAIHRIFKKEDFIDEKDWNSLRKKEGSLQIWIEGAMTEKGRSEKGLHPPDAGFWGQQHQMLHLFDSLIYNDDRNQGNILIGRDWKIWFIDATRAFRPYRELKHPKVIFRCESQVWENLKSLTPDILREELDPFLKSNELETLIYRHQLLVDHIQARIDQMGESVVLFETQVPNGSIPLSPSLATNLE